MGGETAGERGGEKRVWGGGGGDGELQPPSPNSREIPKKARDKGQNTNIPSPL